LAVSLATVAAGATLTALATGLGALPFAFRRTIAAINLGRANALAAGVMVGASIGLAIEGSSWGALTTALGAASGALFVLVVRRALPESPSLHLGALRGAAAAKAILIIVVMTAHSVAEGVGVGVAYGGGETLGITTTVAIALHNIPEGLAISLVLIPRGASVWAAAGWSIFSSLPQPVMAVPAFLLVEAFTDVLPFGLGFAAGAMVLMAATELMPDAKRQAGARHSWVVAAAACAGVVAAQLALGA
jgi:ZIP family zinc transporter